MVGSFSPVLDGEPQERAFEIAKELGASLSASTFDRRSVGLAYGPAGLALFLMYLAKAMGEGRAELERRAVETLFEALRPRQDGPDPGADGSLLDGFPGLAWLAAHMRDLTGGAVDDFLSSIDQVVAAALHDEWRGAFDFADGAIGLGVYLLERPESELTRSALSRVVHHLDALAVRVGEGRLAWLRAVESFPPRVRPATPVFDLGTPRGTPGAMSFLASLIRRGVEVDRASTLLRDASAWLLEQRSEATPRARFGDWRPMTADHPPEPTTRLGWCYGDLGASVAMLSAGRALADKDLESEALGLALLTTGRTSVEDTQIEDAGFCHGAAGAGHLYQRLFMATRDARLREASRRWFLAALGFHKEGEGSGGFASYYPTDDDDTFHEHADPGLLMGASGIGLSLLSACRAVEPAWDRYFLIAND